MKKATLLACACAIAFGAQSLVAQENAQEVTYVSDPTQGVLLNRMRDNWFITAEGGASFYFAHKSIHRDAADRFTPAASIYAGKWFSPVFGGRFGVNFMGLKGLGTGDGWLGSRPGEYHPDGYTKMRFNEVGPVFDLMVNLTNWWCGYKPNRVYNAVFYVGAGGYFTMEKTFKANGESDGWKNAHDAILNVRAGLINSFNVSKQVALSLDLRWTGLEGIQNLGGAGWNEDYMAFQAYLGVTYLFKQREWKAPVVPVCPEPENCDALRARLAAADARIADLEAQLRDCLNRPVETKVENNGPVATVYYPIGVSRLSRENARVVSAIAEVMKANPDTKYVLTGWADNYTGSDNVNKRLRKARVEGVQKLLVNNGVEESRLTATTNDGNLSDLGEKCVAIDRAVTIEEAN